MMFPSDLLLLVLIAICFFCAAADTIHGCGGFIEASPALIKARRPSDGRLDYSHVTVELRTIDGLVKERTQCAPNGYYFLPVYDKGSFVIRVRGPEGWSWDPYSVPVIVDQSGCNANADINFRFTGFTISGRVKGGIGGSSCSIPDGGPSNVKIELLSQLDDPVASTHTSASGAFSFTNIIPGSYKLQASHPNIEIASKSSSEVVLSFGNAFVDDAFFVSGYEIRGYVVAQGNPILGVHMYLYSNDVLDAFCPHGIGDVLGHKNSQCHAISDVDGKFIFRSIPCGSYAIVPYYKGENTVFDVSPPSMSLSVEHHHLTISQKFQVTGFSVGGRVLDADGAGVGGVKIIVDGQFRATTDGQGLYKLDQVTSKQYSILAEKEHYKFSSLDNFLVLPNMTFIEDIKVFHYDVCGLVEIIHENSKATVALTHGPENSRPQVKLTDESGRFCFEAPPGEYRISAMAIKSENSSSLLFAPPYIDLKVTSPQLNVEFFQAHVSVQGRVICKEECGTSISISLLRLMGDGREETKTTGLSDENNGFNFSKVFPGKYLLEVKHEPSTSNEDTWCWDRNSIEIDVTTFDINDIAFVHRGYWISIISTHDASAYISGPGSSRVDLLIKKGPQRLCLESSGEHEIHLVNSCIFFGSTSLKFHTADLSDLYLTGKKSLLKGLIQIDSSFYSSGNDLTEHIVVDALNENRIVLDSIRTNIISEDQNGSAIYEYSIWSAVGEDFIFVPRDTRDSMNKILFYPRERYASVITDGCQPIILPFVGREGMHVKGSVSPAIPGVNIKVVADEDSSNALLKKGELALEVQTGTDGSYVAGPLYDDATYHIEASKAGFHLKEVGLTSFTCLKLGQIRVHIHDGGERDDIFPVVLLSLSGEDGYRNNSISNAGGTFSFDNLFPGSFYLRPLLKEFSFSPPAVAIELGSGESKEVVFHANRVAYSGMGSVSLLTGQPKEGVYIEARSESKGYSEEATTDSYGSFRLRGLLPDTFYVIRVLAKEGFGHNGAIERASPESLTVKVGSGDIQGLNFVVFEQPELTILSSHVEGIDLQNLQPHLSVEIRSASDPSKIESVFALPLSYYFEVRDLPKDRHLLQLRLALPSNTHNFESEILEADLRNQPQIHVGPLKYRINEHHQKQEPTPAPVLQIVVGVLIITIFITMPRLKDLYQMAVGMSPLGSNVASGSKKEIRRAVLRKRSY